MLRARVALAALLLLIWPASASAAGTVSVDSEGYVNFLAGGADTNNLSVTASISGGTATIAFSDSGASLAESAAECQSAGGTVTCVGPLVGWTAKLGPGDDTAIAAGNLEGSIEGEDGNDTLSGSDTNELQEFLNGGNGRDQILARGGTDFVVGEGDDDFVDAGPGGDTIGDAGGEGNDSLAGGDGFDLVSYTGTSLPPAPLETFAVNLLQGSGGRTNLSPESDALVSIEDVSTSGLFAPSGDDSVTGSAGPNQIDTGAGADVIAPGDGPDSVRAGAGDDSVDAVDGASDRIACDHGADGVRADQFDALSECETVALVTVLPPPPDLRPPSCAVRRVKRRMRRRSFVRGPRARVECNEAATLELRLVVRAGVLRARAGDLVLAQRTAAAGTTVRLKPARRLVRRLPRRRGFRARLVVAAVDGAGNRSVEMRRIKVAKAGKRRSRR